MALMISSWVDQKLINLSKKNQQYRMQWLPAFIELANRETISGGEFGFIVSSSYLTSQSFSELRKLLLAETKIRYLVELGGSIFDGANVEANIIIAKKQIVDGNISNVKIIIQKEGLVPNVKLARLVKQSELAKDDDKKFEVYRDEEQNNLFLLLAEHPKMADLFEIRQGIRTGDNKKFLSEEPQGKSWKKILRGRDIKKFGSSWGGMWINYDREKLDAPRDHSIFELSNKVYIRQTGDSIIACKGDDTFLALETLHVLWSKTNQVKDLDFVLGILNSNFYDKIYRAKFNEKGKAFAQVKIAHLKALPFPVLLDEDQKLIAALTRKRLETEEPKERIRLEEQIDEKILISLTQKKKRNKAA